MPAAPTGRATRARRRTGLAVCRLQDADPIPRGQRFLSGSKAMGLDRRHLSLTFLSQQSFGYCPRAKRSRSNTHAGVVGYLFETAHNAIAPMWQPGPTYIRSCELSGVVERAHSNVARKTKGWVEHKIRHAVGTREAYSQFRRHAQSRECWTRNFVSSGIILRPPAGAGGKISQRRDRVSCRHLQDFQRKSPAETGLRLWMTRRRRDVVSSVMT